MFKHYPAHVNFRVHSLAALLVLTLAGVVFSGAAQAKSEVAATQLCHANADFPVRKLADDSSLDFCDAIKGKVTLVVNTASRCGYTDQYDGLEKLYARYREQGLVVVGFPSNDFNQEPGTEEEIKSFCRLTYGVKFPMFAKTNVRGRSADPLFKALAEISGQEPRWNFHKYLIDRDGNVIESFSSRVEPESRKLVGQIERLL